MTALGVKLLHKSYVNILNAVILNYQMKYSVKQVNSVTIRSQDGTLRLSGNLKTLHAPHA